MQFFGNFKINLKIRQVLNKQINAIHLHILIIIATSSYWFLHCTDDNRFLSLMSKLCDNNSFWTLYTEYSLKHLIRYSSDLFIFFYRIILNSFSIEFCEYKFDSINIIACLASLQSFTICSLYFPNLFIKICLISSGPCLKYTIEIWSFSSGRILSL